MTFFTEENEDAISGGYDSLAHGPRVGFMEGFSTGYDAHVRASAQSGMWAAFADEEDAQKRAMKEAGIENMPNIGMEDFGIPDIGIFGDEDFFLYKRAARYYSGSGDEKTAERLRKYDARIEELRKTNPDLKLKTGREIFDEVIRKGREAEQKMQSDNRTFGGAVGDFFGQAIAGVNPRTDEFNAMTLGIGGPGKTVVGRIAAEAGLQGTVELVNQVTGVQEQREMMGLSHGVADATTRVAGTAIAGGVLQGVGEGVAYAGKRWFRSVEGDMAPPPPKPYKPDPNEPLMLEYKPADWEGQAAWEADVRAYQEGLIRDLMYGVRDYTDDIIPMANYGQTRRGAARARLDIDHVSSRLDAWDGELPHQIKPRTDTAVPNEVGVNFKSDYDIHAPGSRIDAMAREVDPKLFNEFDKLADRKAEYRRWLEDPRYLDKQTKAVEKAVAEVEELSKRIDSLKRNMGRVGKRRKAEMQTKLDALQEKKAVAVDEAIKKDTPEMAAIRRELIKTDEKMRDMAPEVARAYAHARGQWELDAPHREAVQAMIEQGRKDIPLADAPKSEDLGVNPFDRFTPTLEEQAPILKQRTKVDTQIREGADAADIAQTILRENEKVMDEALSSYRASLEQIVKTEKDGVITINGDKFKFDLDKDTVYIPLEDGTGSKRVTIRELLEENADTEAQLKATQTCSIL